VPDSSPSRGSAPPSVSCRGVRKVYAGAQPVVALDELDLEVVPGEFLALVGDSGSGKSTLLHLLGAIDRPTSGSIAVGGVALADLTEPRRVLYRRRDVGMVFQFFNLLPHLTVRDNVELPRRLDGGRDAGARAAALLERVGLADRGAAHPYELSGGEMQRVAIARALVTGARLLLADEPTGNLDTRNGNQVLALLDEVRRERGVTLLLATHSRAAAERADRVAVLCDGRIEAFEKRPPSSETKLVR
jgi:putative ABC transport system ATP-binding protein